MAEFVNARMEDMINELEQMKRMELYSADEIKELSKKRKEFEYKIHRQVRCKDDFSRYVAFECVLLHDIKLRREKFMLTEKKNDIEFTISKRVSKLYKEMISRFPNDIDVWLNFMKFCKCVDFLHTITSYLEKLVQIHGEKPKVWQLASRWEYEEMSNFENARQFLLKGLHRHPKDENLYLDAFRLELLVAEAVDKDKDDRLKRAETVMSSSLKEIDDVKFIIKLHSVLDDFDFVSTLKKSLFKIMWKKYIDNMETWNYVAMCELKDKDVSGFDWKSTVDSDFSFEVEQKVLNFIKVYETAHQKNMDRVYLHFANNVIEWIKNNQDTDPLLQLQILSYSFSKGHECKQLEEKHYKIWIDILKCQKIDNADEISLILKEASAQHPKSRFLWSERMQLASNDNKELLKIFKAAKRCVSPEDLSSIWRIVIEYCREITELKKLQDEAAMCIPKVASMVKPLLLHGFEKLGGAQTARAEYALMVNVPPLVPELHDAMIDIESKRDDPDVEFLRRCHEAACHRFGATNLNVWLQYVEFETKLGRPERCGLLHARARAALDAELLAEFLSKYGRIE